MARLATSFRLFVASIALVTAALGVTVAPSTARAVDHTQVVPRAGFGHEGSGQQRFGHEGFGNQRFGNERFEHRFRRNPSLGLFYGAPAVVVPPPLYYDPSYGSYPDGSYPDGSYPDATYSYAPVPLSDIYVTGNGYCRDYQTTAGVETACQQADGIWRYIN